jgi:hypothetical protein
VGSHAARQNGNVGRRENSGRKLLKVTLITGKKDMCNPDAHTGHVPKNVTKNPTKSCCKLYLETEEWVSG